MKPTPSQILCEIREAFSFAPGRVIRCQDDRVTILVALKTVVTERKVSVFVTVAWETIRDAPCWRKLIRDMASSMRYQLLSQI